MIDALRDYGLLKLAGSVELEEVASSEGKGHALIVGLEVVVDFRQDESRELAFGEGFIFVKSLATRGKQSHQSARIKEREGRSLVKGP